MKLLVNALAIHRLNKLVIEDYITKDLREKYWNRFPKNTKMGYLITCPWCVSMWTSGGLLALQIIHPPTGKFVSEALALSAIAGIAAEKDI